MSKLTTNSKLSLTNIVLKTKQFEKCTPVLSALMKRCHRVNNIAPFTLWKLRLLAADEESTRIRFVGGHKLSN